MRDRRSVVGLKVSPHDYYFSIGTAQTFSLSCRPKYPIVAGEQALGRFAEKRAERDGRGPTARSGRGKKLARADRKSRVGRHSPTRWRYRAWLSPEDHGDPYDTTHPSIRIFLNRLYKDVGLRRSLSAHGRNLLAGGPTRTLTKRCQNKHNRKEKLERGRSALGLRGKK